MKSQSTMGVFCTVLLLLIFSLMTLGNESVENAHVEVTFVQGSPCLSVTWDPPKTMAIDVDYYSIELYTASVTYSALRTYLISNYTDRTVKDCLVLKETRYTISLRVHYSGGLVGAATNVSVVTNYLQDASFKQNGNLFTVQCKVANADTLVACRVTMEAISRMNGSIMVLNAVILQESNVSLLLPLERRDYTATVTVVNTLGVSVEEFGIVHNFASIEPEETVVMINKQGNAENNTKGTNDTMDTDHSCTHVKLIVYVVISVNIMVVIILVMIVYLCKGVCQKRRQTAMFDNVSCNSSVEYIDETKTPIVLCTKPELTTGHCKRSSSFDQAEFPPAYTADDNNSIKDEEETNQSDTINSHTILPNNQTTLY